MYIRTIYLSSDLRYSPPIPVRPIKSPIIHGLDHKPPKKLDGIKLRKLPNPYPILLSLPPKTTIYHAYQNYQI